jgi:hypothetical protein
MSTFATSDPLGGSMVSRPGVDAREQGREQARQEVAVAAARQARRNTPTHLIVIAVVLMGIALICTLVAAGSRAAALSRLDTQKRQAARVAELVARLNQLTDAERAGIQRWGQPAERVQSKIQQAATQAGLKAAIPPVNPTKSSPVGDAQRIQFKYDIRDESLPALLKWVEIATRDVPGLEVYSVRIRPEANQWDLNVTFSRWERTR